MNKFWIVLSHTYMTRLKSKSFLISTAITLLFISGLANIDKIIETFSSDDKDQVAVIDESGQLLEGLQESMEAVNEDMELVAYDESVSEGKKAVEDEEYVALLTLSLNDEMLPEATYYSNEISDTGTKSALEQQLQQLKVAIATNQAGIEQEKMAEIYAPVSFETVALDQNAKTEEELMQAQGIVYIMLFVLYMAVILYGQMIATDVATEKSSRVMEILISSASPITHMFAKIFGIALLGLTQIGLLFGVGYSLILTNEDGILAEMLGLNDLSMSIVLYAVIFFVLGYLLYATMAAMLGSLVSRVEDVQQLLMPMMVLVIIAFFIAMFGLNAPDSNFVVIASYIPFFSPMVMFLRVGMLTIPTWEVFLSIGILIATILLFAYLGARIYKGGVLMYGRSSSLKDFKKAMDLSKKEK